MRSSGLRGESIKVKDGFERDFLIPPGRARCATPPAKADLVAKRAELEKAASPQDTAAVLDVRLPLDQHLGAPVDYGLYLVGRMAHEVSLVDFGVPDFNLDSDRGYAWHCWDWDRSDIPCVPDINPAFGEDYGYPLPCTSPQLFHADHDCPSVPGRWYDESEDLAVHYLPGGNPGTCPPRKPHEPNTDPNWRERARHGKG